MTAGVAAPPLAWWAPVLALARKDARQAWPLAAAGGVGVAAVSLLDRLVLGRLVLDGELAGDALGFAVLAVPALAAAALGGLARAGEQAAGTLRFVAALPVAAGVRDGVQLGVHGLAAAAVVIVGQLAAWLAGGGAGPAWLGVADAPAGDVGALAVAAALLAFAAAALAARRHDEPAAAAAVGAMAALGALVPCLLGGLALAGGSWTEGLAAGGRLALVPALAVAAVLAWCVRGVGAASAAGRRHLVASAAALLVAAALLPPWWSTELGAARALAGGGGRVLEAPVPPHRTGRLAVLRMAAGDGRPREVVLRLGDRPKAGRRTPLPPGVHAVGWLRLTTDLVVEWPGHGRRLVPPGRGRIRAFAGDWEPAAPADGMPRVEVVDGGAWLVSARSRESIHEVPESTHPMPESETTR